MMKVSTEAVATEKTSDGTMRGPVLGAECIWESSVLKKNGCADALEYG